MAAIAFSGQDHRVIILSGSPFAPDTASSWWAIVVAVVVGGFTVLATAFTGVATLAAVAVALWSSARDRRERLWVERRAQAEKISVWLDRSEGKPIGTFAISNASDSPIYEVVFSVGDAREGHTEFVPATDDGQNLSAVAMVPLGRWEVARPERFESGGMGMVTGAAVYFRDARGLAWLRGAGGKLTQITEAPVVAAGLVQPFTEWGVPVELERGPEDRRRRLPFAESLTGWLFQASVAHARNRGVVPMPRALDGHRIASRDVTAETLEKWAVDEVGRKITSGMTDEELATQFSYIENVIRLWASDPTRAVEQIEIQADQRAEFDS